jgi:UDP-N-acetylmuramate dehydrogenase
VQDIAAEPLEGAGEGSRVRVGAGCSMAALVSWCTDNGLTGLEFMAGIPGTVGGAIRMNAGAFGHAISEVLQGVQWTNDQGEMLGAARDDIIFSYRHSLFPGEPCGKMLITRAGFLLQRAERELVAARCREVIEQRSAGSFFKNPAGDFAGRLIEQAGLKGLTFGKAMVSPRHANFIVNTGGAVPSDIIGLMQEIRRKVLQHSGVLLEPEVHIF